jgi:hypothetical protein
MNDWNRFAQMVNAESFNVIELQTYVDALNPITTSNSFTNNNTPSQTPVNPLLMQSQGQPNNNLEKPLYYNQSLVYNRKKEEVINTPYEGSQVQSQGQGQDINYNLSKTFGGEKSKIPTLPIKPEYEDISKKGMPNNNNNVPPKEDITKYRSTTQNVGNMYKDTIDNAPLMLANL